MVLHKLNGIFPLPIPPKVNCRSKQFYGLNGWWPTVNTPLLTSGALRDWSLKGIKNANTRGTSFPVTTLDPLMGMKADFVSANGNYLEVSNGPLLNPSTLSVSCWIKTTTNTTQQLMTRDTIANGRAWQFRINITTGTITFVVWNVSTLADATGTTNLIDGNWHLVIGTWDGITIKVYVDGKLEGSTAFTGPLISTVTSNLMIGSAFGASSPEYFNGVMADMRLYGRAISNVECFQMWDSQTRWELFDVGLDHRKPRYPVVNLAAFNFTGSSTITVNAITFLLGQLELSGNATVTIDVLKTLFGDIGFSGNSIVTFDSLKILLAQLNVSGNSTVTIDAIKTLLGNLIISGESTVTLNAKLEASGVFNVLGDAQSTFSPVAMFVGGFNLFGNATVTIESIIVILIGSQDPNRLLIVEYEQNTNQTRTYSLEVENDIVLSATVEY